MLGTSNHNSLMPVTLLAGGALALLCNLICVLPGESGVIPLNAVTPILGAPVIIYVIINQRRIQYFNCAFRSEFSAFSWRTDMSAGSERSR